MKKVLLCLFAALGWCAVATAQSLELPRTYGQHYFKMKNYPKALENLKRLEDALDRFLLGFMHANGLDVKPDMTEALRWYRQFFDHEIPGDL